MLAKKKKTRFIFIILILILLCFIGIGMSDGTGTSSPFTPAWTKWGYDFEATHYYPFPTSRFVNLDDFYPLWTLSGNFSGIRTGDIDSNGLLEIVCTGSQTVKVFDLNGNLKWSVSNKGDIVTLADVDRDGLLNLLISNFKVSSNQGGIAVFDGYGHLQKTLAGPVGADGNLSHCRAGDFDRDRELEIAADVAAADSASPRGLYMFNYESGNLEWFYSLGPAGWSSSGDIDGDGRIEFVFGGESRHNGGYGDGVNHSATPTSDDDIYTIVFNSEDGSESFTLDYFSDGESNGCVEHALVDLAQNGDTNILAFEGHSGSYPGTLQVHLIDENGVVQKTWNGPYISSGEHLASSWAVGDINGDGFPEIVFSFQNYDKLWLLDQDLVEITSRSFGHPLHHGESYFVINDINGDKKNEIITKDWNDGKVIVLAEDLDELWTYPVSAGESDLVISDLNSDGINEIIVGGSQVFVLGFIPTQPEDAVIDINPDTLNLKSQGKWITCYIELPADVDVNDIDPASVKIIQIGGKEIEIFSNERPTAIGDYDGDGTADLMVKFSRSNIISKLKSQFGNIMNKIKKFRGEISLRISGKVNHTRFEGVDTIRIIN